MKNYKIYLYTKFVGVPQVPKCYPVGERCSGVFRLGSYDKYIKELLSEERIESRLIFFKELTLKSILSQTYANFEWIIFISNLLPQKYKEYIEAVRNTDSRIKIIEVEGLRKDNDFLRTLHSPPEESYISCRLDDDDALRSDYFEILNNEFNNDKSIEVAGSVDYYMVMRDENSDNFLYTTNAGKGKFLISAGLSCKDRHIYSIGSHSSILTKKIYKSKILDEKFVAIQTAGIHTFTKRRPADNSNIKPFYVESYLSRNL